MLQQRVFTVADRLWILIRHFWYKYINTFVRVRHQLLYAINRTKKRVKCF